jgi:hypothetical protein
METSVPNQAITLLYLSTKPLDACFFHRPFGYRGNRFDRAGAVTVPSVIYR